MPTTQRQFRLPDSAIDDLARIAEHLRGLTGSEATRTDALLFAIHQAARRLPAAGKKVQKKSP